jgi:hypothetical protein
MHKINYLIGNGWMIILKGERRVVLNFRRASQLMEENYQILIYLP